MSTTFQRNYRLKLFFPLKTIITIKCSLALFPRFLRSFWQLWTETTSWFPIQTESVLSLFHPVSPAGRRPNSVHFHSTQQLLTKCCDSLRAFMENWFSLRWKDKGSISWVMIRWSVLNTNLFTCNTRFVLSKHSLSTHVLLLTYVY